MHGLLRTPDSTPLARLRVEDNGRQKPPILVQKQLASPRHANKTQGAPQSSVGARTLLHGFPIQRTKRLSADSSANTENPNQNEPPRGAIPSFSARRGNWPITALHPARGHEVAFPGLDPPAGERLKICGCKGAAASSASAAGQTGSLLAKRWSVFVPPLAFLKRADRRGFMRIETKVLKSSRPLSKMRKPSAASSQPRDSRMNAVPSQPAASHRARPSSIVRARGQTLHPFPSEPHLPRLKPPRRTREPKYPAVAATPYPPLPTAEINESNETLIHPPTAIKLLLVLWWPKISAAKSRSARQPQREHPQPNPSLCTTRSLPRAPRAREAPRPSSVPPFPWNKFPLCCFPADAWQGPRAGSKSSESVPCVWEGCPPVRS